MNRNYREKIRNIEIRAGYTISKERINHLKKTVSSGGKAGVLNFKNEILCN